MKICVYAICKNEKKFVESWLDSVSEADYVVVLDTGSTDGTYEMLKSDPRVTRCEQEIITPWRFDVARNKSMELCPENADVLVCADLDEVFNEGWTGLVRKKWKVGQHRRGYYRYAWSHSETGEPLVTYFYDKMHTRDFKWVYPCHEVLERFDGWRGPETKETSCTVSEDIILNHWPDDTKTRSYLPLLEIRAQENPEEPYGWYLLGREYGKEGQIEKAIEIFNHCLSLEEVNNYPEIRMGCNCYLGDCYRLKGEYDLAIEYYAEWINLDPTYADPYYNIADIYNAQGKYEWAVNTITQAEERCYQHYSWLEDANTWYSRKYDLLAVSYYYLGEWDKGITAGQEAVRLHPEDPRILKNYIALLEHKYILH